MKPIDPRIESEKIIKFLKTTFANAGFTRAVVGVSGGVDSSVSCALTIQALGAINVYPVLMPYSINSMQSTLDGMNVLEALHVPIGQITRIDIKAGVDAMVSAGGGVENVRRGNIMARMRMIALYDQAKKRSALVVGTENKSEHLLGYFTRFGDEASDVEPIRMLYKTQVYELAKYLEIPEVIITKAPTADLWMGQTDEKEFGFTYKEADEILSLAIDQKKSIDEIVKAGFSLEIIQRVLNRVKANEFKHILPYVKEQSSEV
jgi:NAD+ synthase